MNTILHKVDLLVVGGGVAGTVAAIAAARRGLKTVLVQNRPVLGGPSSSECSCNADGACINGAQEYINRNARECGILEEMKLEAYYRRANGWEQHWSLVLREWAEREEDLTQLLMGQHGGSLGEVSAFMLLHQSAPFQFLHSLAQTEGFKQRPPSAPDGPHDRVSLMGFQCRGDILGAHLEAAHGSNFNFAM